MADEHELMRLQLAFAYHMIEEVIRSDADLEGAETDYLAEVFPRTLLRDLGFEDAQGRRTEAFAEARDLALVVLPERLTDGEKLGLLDLLVGASAADGVLTAEEADALAAGARMLGVPESSVVERIDALLGSGGVRRGE